MTVAVVCPARDGRIGRARRVPVGMVLALVALAPIAPARAASRANPCPPSAVSWDGAARVLGVSGKVTCTLKALADAGTGAPLTQADRAGKVWFLGADLLLENGAKLLLHGGSGDVNELRLRSNNSSNPSSFATISADWGTIDIKDTRITSWDEAVGGPDTEYVTFGRANLQAHSFLDPSGKARESRLDIANSDIGYLGYEGPQAYGISWKVDGSSPGLYDAVGVYGNVTGSHIHDNYFGVFTYGAEGMRFAGNEFDHNVNYGIDPHDDSDSLTIEDNYVHDNGRHGIICSQRCNNLTIRRNRVIANAGHGIMLHRSVTDSVVEDNEVTGNGEGGVALFESHRNTIRRNQIRGNNVGVRVSVGSSDNEVESNQIADSTSDGMFFYQGSDAPIEGDGHPRRNHVVANSFTGNAGYAVRLTDADDNVFEGNTYSGNGGVFGLDRSSGNTIDGPETPSGGADLPGPGPASVADRPTSGYWLAASDGGIFTFGDASFLGSIGDRRLNQPIVDMAATPSGQGYWLVASDGGIFAFGEAAFLGSTGGHALNRPVVAMASTPSGLGYWLVASDGGIFTFGDAGFYGSTAGRGLGRPVVDMAATPSGQGYWLVASDGGVFTFGDAGFYGSTGGRSLASPIVGMASAPSGQGYWLVASDGGIFAFGEATFLGSMGGHALNRPVVAMASTPSGLGYWLVASDGGIFTFGDAPFAGSTGGQPLTRPLLSLVPSP